MAWLLVACAPAPSLLLLNFPEPDEAKALVLQKVSVEDERPTPDIRINPAGTLDGRYRPFPDLADVLQLYLGEVLLKERPGFALQMPISPVYLSVRIKAVEGQAMPDSASPSGERIRLTYHVTAVTSVAGASTIDYRWSTDVLPGLDAEDEALAAELEGSLRRQARVIIRDFVREASPYMTPLQAPPAPQFRS